MNPSSGRTSRPWTPLEWLARLSDHIPDPGRTKPFFYASYACRTRAAREQDRGVRPKPRRAFSTWERLIHKVFRAHPLTCTNCSAQMKLIACFTKPRWMRTFLQHTELGPP